MLAQRASLEPWMPDSIEYFEHQLEGVRKMKDMKAILLADDMGLGKTLQVLTVFVVGMKMADRHRRKHPEQDFPKFETMLVVCPVNLRDNWQNEIEAFTTLPYMMLEGSPKERDIKLVKFASIQGPKILVVNYEQVDPHVNELNGIGFDVMAFDEAHMFANHKAKRTKAVHKLRSRRTILMTGSPMLNMVDGMWALLHKLDPQEFPDYWRFTQRYCVYGGFKGKAIQGVKNQRELREKLSRYMIRRLKSEVLDLPEVQYIRRTVHLHPKQKEMYDEAREDLRITVNGEEIDVDNDLTRFLRLKQICGTTAAIEGYEGDYSNKLDLAVSDLVELVENGNKVVVFTQFRAVLDCFAKRLATAIPDTPVYQLHGNIPKADRQPIVNRWANHEGAAVVVGMLQVIGVGLNMTAARHGLFLDKLFTPMLNQQAVDRLNRIGASTTQAIQIFEYYTTNTVEARVEKILKTKRDLFENVVETSQSRKELLKLILAAEVEAAARGE